MVVPAQPFPLSRKLPRALGRAHRLWKDLIRAENTMPFSDDVSLSGYGNLSANLLLINVLPSSQRFRFNQLGAKILARAGANFHDKFADELELREPFDYFVAQASATVEAGAPTFYASNPRRRTARRGYSRLILPSWGNGRVDLLLCAIV